MMPLPSLPLPLLLVSALLLLLLILLLLLQSASESCVRGLAVYMRALYIPRFMCTP